MTETGDGRTETGVGETGGCLCEREDEMPDINKFEDMEVWKRG
jgi:hypothetical protein